MIAPTRPARLTVPQIRAAAEHLGARDGDLRALLRAQGPPPLWGRPPGFETLVKIILEQQVSLASADAVFRRLQARIVPFSSERLAAVGETGLRSHGVTCQKAAYCVPLASALSHGRRALSAVR